MRRSSSAGFLSAVLVVALAFTSAPSASAVGSERPVATSTAAVAEDEASAILTGQVRAQYDTTSPGSQPVFIWRMEDGKPSWAGMAGRTDTYGRYRIETPPGLITLSFGSDGLLWLGGRYTARDAVWLEVAPGEQALPDTRQSRRGFAEGVVTSEGEPVENAQVQLHVFSDDGTLVDTMAYARTAADGTFLLQAPYGVRARASVTVNNLEWRWWQDAAGERTFTLGGYPAPRVDIDLPPVLPAGVPTVAGSLVVGTRLTANVGSWPAGTTFRYQWFVDGQEAIDATASTFVLEPYTAGSRVSVRVVASNPDYLASTATSASRGPVILISSPRIEGRAIVGQVLSVPPLNWQPAVSYAYRWYADGKAIAGATASRLKLTTAQAGKRITVRVSGTPAGHDAVVARSSAATLRTGTWTTPTIAGTRQVGYTLTAHRGVWTSGASIRYRWYASGKAIPGATGSKLRLTSSMRGKTITVKVTAAKTDFATLTRYSAATGRIR